MIAGFKRKFSNPTEHGRLSSSSSKNSLIEESASATRPEKASNEDPEELVGLQEWPAYNCPKAPCPSREILSEDIGLVGGVVEDIIDESLNATSDVVVDAIMNEIFDAVFPEEEVEIYCEQYKANGSMIQYFVRGSELRTNYCTPPVPTTLKGRFLKLCQDAFLPYGYPETVSSDYADYQTWDTVQAFFSTLTGALTTHAIMKGVGVGDVEATAASAAVTWIIKDGTGMIGRIVFAWWKGTEFDSDCKKWRLFADALNDIAMFLELLLPYLSHSIYVLCISTTMKSVVGVAGGATRAALTQHQAICGNMADVSAKDGSQESFVNLIASITGVCILVMFTDGKYLWDMFIFFTICHLLANYRAVRAVQMSTLNVARYVLILRCYLALKSTGTIKAINRNESVILGHGCSVLEFCGFRIKMGASMKEAKLDTLGMPRLEIMRHYYQKKKYLPYVDIPNQTIHVFLRHDAKSLDVIEAFYHAALLGIGTSMRNDIPLVVIERKHWSVRNSPIDVMGEDIRDKFMEGDPVDIVMKAVGLAVKTDFPEFLSELVAQGWAINRTHLDVDHWRGLW